MSNHLEDFISNNRKDFDSEVPPGNVWENIESALTGKKKTKLIHMPIFKWSMAAASILIIAITVYFKFSATEPAETINNKQADMEKSVPEEYAPQMNAFAKLIDMKQEELKVLSKEQPQLYRKFTTDIIQLDSSYNALKEQLSVSPNKEMLIEAMIQNLQLQLSVLNQQLNIIKEIKQSKKYSHEQSFQTI